MNRFKDVHNFVLQLALAAADQAKSQRSKVKSELKEDTTIVTSAEQAIQARIVAEIRSHFPNHGIIAEEESDEVTPLPWHPNEDWIWLIDPIDGTREFVDPSSTFYGISITVLLKGFPVSSVFVAPEYNLLIDSPDQQGSVVEALAEQPGIVVNGETIISCKKNRDRQVAILSQTIQESVPNWRTLGAQFEKLESRTRSALLSLCRVAVGGEEAPSLYVFGRTDIWNVVAGAFFVEQTGGVAVDIGGRRLLPIRQDILCGTLPEVRSIVAGSRQIVNDVLKRAQEFRIPEVRILRFREEDIPESQNYYSKEIGKDRSSQKINVEEWNTTLLAHHILAFFSMPEWSEAKSVFLSGGLAEKDFGKVVRDLVQSKSPQRRIEIMPQEPAKAALIGASHLLPRERMGNVAVTADLGGTSLRVGLIEFPGQAQAQIDQFRQVKWRKAVSTQVGLLQLLSDYISSVWREALVKHPDVSRTVCLSIPGLVTPEGYILRGGSALPGDWTAPNLHVAKRLEGLLQNAGTPVSIVAHNDGVAHALYLRPVLKHYGRTAIFSLGTGLGNSLVEPI